MVLVGKGSQPVVFSSSFHDNGSIWPSLWLAWWFVIQCQTTSELSGILTVIGVLLKLCYFLNTSILSTLQIFMFNVLYNFFHSYMAVVCFMCVEFWCRTTWRPLVVTITSRKMLWEFQIMGKRCVFGSPCHYCMHCNEWVSVLYLNGWTGWDSISWNESELCLCAVQMVGLIVAWYSYVGILPETFSNMH